MFFIFGFYIIILMLHRLHNGKFTTNTFSELVDLLRMSLSPNQSLQLMAESFIRLLIQKKSYSETGGRLYDEYLKYFHFQNKFFQNLKIRIVKFFPRIQMYLYHLLHYWSFIDQFGAIRFMI